MQYLEQLHGTSSEPVMLTDESDRVLWANTAFKRASSERTSGRMQVRKFFNKLIPDYVVAMVHFTMMVLPQIPILSALEEIAEDVFLGRRVDLV